MPLVPFDDDDDFNDYFDAAPKSADDDTADLFPPAAPATPTLETPVPPVDDGFVDTSFAAARPVAVDAARGDVYYVDPGMVVDPPAVDPLLGNVDWLELSRQKATLYRLLGDGHDAPDAEHLEGLIAFLDHVQDWAEGEGYPVVRVVSADDWSADGGPDLAGVGRVGGPNG